ncbi:glycoside hydrolase family 95 protein [Anaeromicropila herbilytica]|uniref:Alpha/beta hydrolase n=1 Tax=Anaeromicropila herbilytica TaxID=2785025 RepID=A0A7R7IDR1_9FIRM|nr:glycoside hydrolase family 95 protein [Anaeromicropila herbilytica]BCN31807.1 alpha/beta hydrolase [Anaeromicropila herbilytica]
MNLNNNKKQKLWYNEPATAWVEALPLGNGRLGAMVYGDPFHETIQMNEETVWSTGDHSLDKSQSKEQVKKIQEAILEGNLKEADILTKEAYDGTNQGSYQILGNIKLDFQYGEGKQKTVHTYRRELDLETAISRVRYTVGGVNYRIESLVSAIDNVYAMSMTANEGLSIQLEATLDRPENYEVHNGELPISIVMKGQCGDETSLHYCGMLQIIPNFNGWGKEGHATCENGKIRIENASSLVILFTAATDYKSVSPEQLCIEYLQSAVNKGFDAIKKDHIEEYSKLFKRMELSLGEDRLYEFLPTNERLMRLSEGDMDNALIALYYQFGRYLLISSSRKENELPANLQGIWNNLMFGPWGSRFTININTEMNYWIAEQCNLSECHEPLFRLIEKMKEKGRIVAKEMYGCRGFMAHHDTNIWGDATPQENWPSATSWPMGAAWLCLHIWEHYEYTMDQEFLVKAYPTLKEACEFFVDFLVEDKEGRLVTCPSLSPENVYRTEDGYETSVCAGPTMDNSIIRKLFGATMESAQILGVDEDFIVQLEQIKNRLPELKISSNGTIMEWPDDYEEVEIGHRHISQLFALHPSGEITLDNTPELANAARKTLERRLSHGGGHTGWSCAWIINMWARLQDAKNAHKYVQTILSKSTYPNMFDAHPPFQIDGNFGATAGITEMLLQSNGGVINLLPALPEEWSNGYMNGVRARGNYEVDMEWQNGELTKAVIHTNTSTAQGKEAIQTVRVKYKEINKYIVRCNDEVVPYKELEHGIISFEIHNGEQYSIVRK